jgi:serine/threonine protein kinase
MSPEQIEAKEPTAAADQFSLGVVVYQLLTGAMPFEADSIGSTLEGVLRRTPQPPDILNPSLGAQASVVILKALEKDPNQRYASCTEFVSRLLEATSRLSGWNLPQTPTKRSDRERTKSPLVEAPPVAAVPSPVPAEATAISRLQQLEAPDDFVTQKSTFFRASRARFESIEDSIRFYRENLNSDYQRLAKQADLAYKLWLGCVAVGFIVLAIGVVMMLTTDVKRGAVTSASTVLVYFIQRVFQQREDHYRTAADEKSSHLEYGNQWLLVIQSLDGIQNDEERIKRQARLVDVLTQKLEQKSKALEKGRSQGPKKKTRGDVGSASIH